MSVKKDDLSSQLPFFHGTSKPFLRWWWLAGPFTHDDIERQLKWVLDSGFGGVELAWLYPAWLEQEQATDLRPAWLGPEWSELVAFTKSTADTLGLGCDFTFGSCWPFGGSWVQTDDAAQTFNSPSDQRLRCSWEEPVYGPTLVLNHLSSEALHRYASPLLEPLRDALSGSLSALFCDSLELDTNQMWSPELWSEFERRFGYDLRPFSGELAANRDVRYDYRKLIADAILRNFYEAFAEICHSSHAYARVQCHGAPTDLLAAYAAVDVPESESLLFPPTFSRIAASAAAWAGNPVASAESFTCIYGFPGFDPDAELYSKKENIADLKLLADALFANGINQIVWHGMPYQPAGKEVHFYASVHVGPDSPFATELRAFNRYLEKVSALLKLGNPYGGLGVYLGFEDARMLDRLPRKQRTPGANHHWEMRYAVPPAEAESFHPLWVSFPFLQAATVEDGVIRSRELSLDGLYVDCRWLDADSLTELLRLARAGASIICKRRFRQPGHLQNPTYKADLDELIGRSSNILAPAQLEPLLEGQDLPWYWARALGDDLLIFFAHPNVKLIRYPLTYGLSFLGNVIRREAVLRWRDREFALELQFEPYQSLMLLARASGTVEVIDIRYLPPEPHTSLSSFPVQ